MAKSGKVKHLLYEDMTCTRCHELSGSAEVTPFVFDRIDTLGLVNLKTSLSTPT